MPWGLAGHTQGRLTPGRFIIIRQVYNPLAVLQPSPVSTWTTRFQQHRRSTGVFQSCPVPAPCPSTGSASASWLQHCRNPRWHCTVLPTAGQQLPGSAPPLLLPVALPLLLQTGLVCRGKQMLCMVRIFPAAVCAGDGWSCSAELGPCWVQPSLRRASGIPQGSSQPREAGRARWATTGWEGAGLGKGTALPVPGIRDVCPECPAAPAAAGPLTPCHPPTPSQRDFEFPLLCRASIPSSASL